MYLSINPFINPFVHPSIHPCCHIMTCVLPVNVDRAFLGLKMYGTDKARCPIASSNYSIPQHPKYWLQQAAAVLSSQSFQKAICTVRPATMLPALLPTCVLRREACATWTHMHKHTDTHTHMHAPYRDHRPSSPPAHLLPRRINRTSIHGIEDQLIAACTWIAFHSRTPDRNHVLPVVLPRPASLESEQVQ